MNAITPRFACRGLHLQTAVLVLADVQEIHAPPTDPNYQAALQNCRIALSFAREGGIPVAFARRVYPWLLTHAPWLPGFMPSCSDMIFERTHHSCYASDAFAQMADAAGTLAFAGFFSESTAVATTFDALRRGARIAFLHDASWSDADSAHPAYELHKAATAIISTHAEVCTTGDWISAMSWERR